MGRTLVCADLHGCGKLWDYIKTTLKEDDILYMLGDAGDRGSESWRVLKEAVLHPQVIYILGNHDEMFIRGMKNHNDRILWFYNGGRQTWDEAQHDPEVVDILEKLKKCPTHQEYINKKRQRIYLNHSGCISNDPYIELWDRRHYFLNNLPEEYDVIVHGHTPIDSMIEDFNSYHYNPDYDWEYGHVCYYWDKTKINIDCGSYWSGFTILLNLDTFEEYRIGKVGCP